MLETKREGVAIIVASVGRPVELGRWIDHVGRQTLQPVEMIWVVNNPDDLPAAFCMCTTVPLRVLRCARGSARQRNAGLDALSSNPAIVAFFDDDYVPTSHCLAKMVEAFEAMPDVIGLTGHLLADGINGPGVSYRTALALVDDHEQSAQRQGHCMTFEPWDGLYGCNMALRAQSIGQERFDERLPLYGWQEDVDFAMRVAAGRPLGRTNNFVGVHQGTKNGRTSGRRFGYSQIVNPAYLYRKGSMSRGKMLTLMGRNFLANHVRFLRPEPWVDRRGRIVGNWIGLIDLVLGRARPERILEFS